MFDDRSGRALAEINRLIGEEDAAKAKADKEKKEKDAKDKEEKDRADKEKAEKDKENKEREEAKKRAAEAAASKDGKGVSAVTMRFVPDRIAYSCRRQSC